MKTKITSMICGVMCLFLATPSLAQWETHGPYGGPVNALKLSGTTLYAGSRNGVFVSNDSGRTWQAANKGMKRMNVTALAVSGSTVLAGTSENGVYFSSDNGNNWTARNNGLTDLHITSLFRSSTGFFAGTPGGAFYTADNGLTWTPASNGIPFTYDVYSWAQMGDTIYGGTYASGMYFTVNNGTSWSAVGNGFPPTVNTGPFVYAMLSNGNTIYAGTNLGVYRTTDRGITWTSSNTGMTAGMHARAFAASSSKVFAGTHTEGIFVSNDNGATWTSSSSGMMDWPKGNGLPHNYATVMEMQVLGQVVIAGTSEGIYRSTDNGATWKHSDHGILGTDITAVAVAGNVIYAGGDWVGMYSSTDAGASWSRVNNGLPSPFVMAAAAQGSVVFAATQNNKVSRSLNMGGTWTSASAGLTADVINLKANEVHVMAITTAGKYYNSKLFESTDQGVSWHEIVGANAISGGLSAMALRGTMIYIGTYNGAVYRSSDNGSSWQDISLYLPPVAITAILATDSAVYVGTDGKGIFKFTNSDFTMVSASAGLTNLRITDIDLKGGIVFASTWGGGVFASANGGVNWFPVNDGLDNHFVRVMDGNETTMYAGTDAGVYNTESGGFARIMLLSGISTQNAASGIRMYPNPASDMIVVEGAVSIEIYDLRGAHILSRTTDGIGGRVDVSNLAAGVYIVKAATATGIQAGRLVIGN